MRTKKLIKYISLLIGLYTVSISLTSQADIFDTQSGEQKMDIFGNVKTESKQKNTLPSNIQVMPLLEIEKKLKLTKGLIAIHLSTDDGSCPYCVDSNTVVNILAQRHSGEMPFWRTSPESYEKLLLSSFARENHLHMIPATLIYKDGQLQRQWIGYDSTSEMEGLFRPLATPEKISSKPLKSRLPVNIPAKGNAKLGIETIDPYELQVRVGSFKGIVAINFSSYDARCADCIDSNPQFDALAKRYEGRVTFWRSMSHPFWNTALSSSFAKQDSFNASIPMVLVFENGKVLRVYRGNNTTDDLERTLFY